MVVVAAQKSEKAGWRRRLHKVAAQAVAGASARMEAEVERFLTRVAA